MCAENDTAVFCDTQNSARGDSAMWIEKKSVDTATIYKPRELPDSGLGLG